MQRFPSSVFALIAIVIFMTACASSPGVKNVKQAEKTIEGLDAFTASIHEFKSRVDAMVTSMNQIELATDRVAAYSDFTKEIDKTEAIVEKARKRANTMRKRREAYFATWTEQVMAINNPELREASEQRQAELNTSFEAITASADTAKDSFESFMENLYDIQVYLGNDLTPSGLDAVSKYRDQATADAESVHQAADAIIAEVDKVRAMIEPGMGPGVPEQ